MVGALADWFAVTALFRHPLGVPIPHTAIIPRRKDEIGRSLGEFVAGQLPHPRGHHRAAGGDRTSVAAPRRAGWPTGATPTRAADAVADGAPRRDRGARRHRRAGRRSSRVVLPRLRSTPVAPLRRPALDIAVEGGHHQRLLDGVAARACRRSSTTTGRRSATRLDQESPWWVPEPIDDRVFNKIFGGVQRFLADVAADPDHEVRASIDVRIRQFAERLRNDPELIAKGEELKEELLAHPDVQAWIGSLWGELKSSILAAADDPDSELRRRLAVGLVRAGERLAIRSRPAAQDRRLGRAPRRLRRRALPRRGRRPDRQHRVALGRRRHVATHRAAGRTRPAVHPDQRHGRRRPRRADHLQPSVSGCSELPAPTHTVVEVARLNAVAAKIATKTGFRDGQSMTLLTTITGLALV